jgi:hypothetical protein
MKMLPQPLLKKLSTNLSATLGALAVAGLFATSALAAESKPASPKSIRYR